MAKALGSTSHRISDGVLSGTFGCIPANAFAGKCNSMQNNGHIGTQRIKLPGVNVSWTHDDSECVCVYTFFSQPSNTWIYIFSVDHHRVRSAFAKSKHRTIKYR